MKTVKVRCPKCKSVFEPTGPCPKCGARVKIIAPKPAPKSKKPLVIGGAVAGAVALAAVAYFALSGGKKPQPPTPPPAATPAPAPTVKAPPPPPTAPGLRSIGKIAQTKRSPRPLRPFEPAFENCVPRLFGLNGWSELLQTDGTLLNVAQESPPPIARFEINGQKYVARRLLHNIRSNMLGLRNYPFKAEDRDAWVDGVTKGGRLPCTKAVLQVEKDFGAITAPDFFLHSVHTAGTLTILNEDLWQGYQQGHTSPASFYTIIDAGRVSETGPGNLVPITHAGKTVFLLLSGFRDGYTCSALAKPGALPSWTLNGVHAAAHLPGSTAFIAWSDTSLRLVDLSTGTVVRELFKGHIDTVLPSSDGKRVAVLIPGGFRLIDPATATLTFEYKGNDTSIGRPAAFCPRGDHFLIIMPTDVLLWNAADNKIGALEPSVFMPETHTSVARGPDGNSLVTLTRSLGSLTAFDRLDVWTLDLPGGRLVRTSTHAGRFLALGDGSVIGGVPRGSNATGEATIFKLPALTPVGTLPLTEYDVDPHVGSAMIVLDRTEMKSTTLKIYPPTGGPARSIEIDLPNVSPPLIREIGGTCVVATAHDKGPQNTPMKSHGYVIDISGSTPRVVCKADPHLSCLSPSGALAILPDERQQPRLCRVSTGVEILDLRATLRFTPVPGTRGFAYSPSERYFAMMAGHLIVADLQTQSIVGKSPTPLGGQMLFLTERRIAVVGEGSAEIFEITGP